MIKDNYTKVSNILIRDGSISHREFRVYTYLRSYNPSHPSTPTICKDLKIGRTTLQNCLESLKERGLISVAKINIRGQTCNCYLFDDEFHSQFYSNSNQEVVPPQDRGCPTTRQRLSHHKTEVVPPQDTNKTKEKEQDSSFFSSSIIDVNNFVTECERFLNAENKITELYEFVSISLSSLPQDKVEQAKNLLAKKIKHQFNITEKSRKLGENVLTKVKALFEQHMHESKFIVSGVLNPSQEDRMLALQEDERKRILDLCTHDFMLNIYGTPEDVIRGEVDASDCLQGEEESLIARYRAELSIGGI